MPEVFGFDAYSPKEIAARVQSAGVSKARLPLLQTAMLGVLAGAFISMGAMFYTLVASDTSLGYAASRVIGGICFSMGLLFVVVAGAELFTGNNLLAMAWAEGSISTFELLRYWLIVCLANFIGAVFIAALVHWSGHWTMNDGAVGATYLKIAASQAALDPWTAFIHGVLCNVLVCMAVWMAMSGRTVIDRFVAIVLPISAFVAAGFEHSIANMYFFPLALMIMANGGYLYAPADGITFGAMFSNLGAVIAGNLVGGSVLVALVYWLIYRRGASDSTPTE
jgi:formate/nitrite transporter